jgi:DNA-binding MarR family transcriptional regulator
MIVFPRATIKRMLNGGDPPGSTVLLTRLAKLFYRRSSEERLGMTLRHFVTLSYLRNHPRTPQHQLDDVFCIGANNLVLLLNELEAADLVERRRDATDRRRHLVDLTPAGEAALQSAERAQQAIEDEILTALTPAERATLHELLARAVAATEPAAEFGSPVGAPLG